MFEVLNQAEKGLNAKNIEMKNTSIQKVQNVLRGLMVTLDMSYTVSESMLNLYEYMIHRLVETNIQNSVQIIDEVIELIMEFRDTWKQIVQINRRKQYVQTGEV